MHWFLWITIQLKLDRADDISASGGIGFWIYRVLIMVPSWNLLPDGQFLLHQPAIPPSVSRLGCDARQNENPAPALAKTGSTVGMLFRSVIKMKKARPQPLPEPGGMSPNASCPVGILWNQPHPSIPVTSCPGCPGDVISGYF